MSRTLIICLVAGSTVMMVLVGCAGPGPEVDALETALPAMSDLDDLTTGDRFRVERQDSTSGILANTRTSGIHAQYYHPKPGHTIEDVLTELVTRAETAGWQPDESPINGPEHWTGEKTIHDGDTYAASVVLRFKAYSTALEDELPFVRLGLHLVAQR